MWLNKDNLLITNTCVLSLFTCLIIFFEKTALPSQYLHIIILKEAETRALSRFEDP